MFRFYAKCENVDVKPKVVLRKREELLKSTRLSEDLTRWFEGTEMRERDERERERERERRERERERETGERKREREIMLKWVSSLTFSAFSSGRNLSLSLSLSLSR